LKREVATKKGRRIARVRYEGLISGIGALFSRNSFLDIQGVEKHEDPYGKSPGSV